jgi:hypothetical protein
LDRNGKSDRRAGHRGSFRHSRAPPKARMTGTRVSVYCYVGLAGAGLARTIGTGATPRATYHGGTAHGPVRRFPMGRRLTSVASVADAECQRATELGARTRQDAAGR